MIRDLVRIRCCIVLQELNCQWSTTMQACKHSLCQENRSPATHWLLALKLHRLRFLLVTSFLLLHLARFLARSVGRLCFCFRGSVGLTVDLVIGGAESRGANVAVDFSGWSL